MYYINKTFETNIKTGFKSFKAETQRGAILIRDRVIRGFPL